MCIKFTVSHLRRPITVCNHKTSKCGYFVVLLFTSPHVKAYKAGTLVKCFHGGSSFYDADMAWEIHVEGLE